MRGRWNNSGRAVPHEPCRATVIVPCKKISHSLLRSWFNKLHPNHGRVSKAAQLCDRVDTTATECTIEGSTATSGNVYELKR